MAVLAALYMKIFLPESIKEGNLSLHTRLIQHHDDDSQLNRVSSRIKHLFKGLPSPSDMISLLKTSSAFSQVALVAFFANLGDVGLSTALMYYLKARFHFSKDQFADLMVIAGVAGTASQLLIMPLLVPAVGEERLLSVGLFFSCAHMFLYSIAWSSSVPYVAAMFSILIVFAHPCLRSIASKQVGPSEQGKAQGCISGVCSFANVISPLIFTPLTALFLSEGAPFSFPGFSITCLAFVVMAAFVQSLLIHAPPSMLGCSTRKWSLLA
uniref:Major facilitator superfamily (MFS) profile domain-containing protein n=2 Tax=Opuntia streptacantha TaxID=393608 RepID=A0A7C9CT19_OPUST